MSEATDVLEKHIKSLPPKFRDAIATVEMKGPLQEIYQKYGLQLDEASQLETETILVATGLEPGDEFVDNIIKNIGLPEVEAIKIANEINDRIFEKIKEKMQNKEPLQNEGEDEPNEKDTLSEVENPKPVGSRLKSIRTPYTEETTGGSIIGNGGESEDETKPQTSPETKQQPDGIVGTNQDTQGSQGGFAKEKEIPNKGEREEGSADPAFQKMSQKTVSKHEEESADEMTAEERKKKYPGGNDPYREPVE